MLQYTNHVQFALHAYSTPRSLLTELSGKNSADVYEAAIHNVATQDGRKAIWLQ